MNNSDKAAEVVKKLAQVAYLTDGEDISDKVKGKKVYLSGPITGVKNYKGLFIFANYLVRMCDARQVFDPASQIPDSLDYGQAMKRCVKALMDYDAIVMLPDWNISQGSKIEHEVAKACGIDVIYLANYVVVRDRYNFIRRELARLL